MNSLHSFILSGGSGTRLWPFSRENYPKQFHDFSGSGKPLLVDTLERLAPLGTSHIVTTQKLASGTEALVNRFEFHAGVLGEPIPRNTAAAVLLAVKHHLFNHQNRDGHDILGIFPADHVITRPKDFVKCITTAIEEAKKDSVVTLGIQPHYPATGYGYIEVKSSGTVSDVARFIEKPNLDKAGELLATNRVFWNAGIFVFRAQVMLELFRKHMPELYQKFETLKPDLSNLTDVYAGCESKSVDVGIMEKVQGLKCVPADMGWTDLGSWEEISAFPQKEKTTSVFQVAGKSNYYSSILNSEAQPQKPVVFVGVEDLVVTDTPDALMILRKGAGQQVRDAVKEVEKQFPKTTQNHCFENRPWGRFEVLRDTDHFKSKLITVLPGQRLSYQSHTKRAEHWTIVKGEAEVTLNDQTLRLRAGEHVYIPLGAKHRIANPAPAGSNQVMEFIEVQTGSYFGEDDITRYSDDYGRKS